MKETVGVSDNRTEKNEKTGKGQTNVREDVGTNSLSRTVGWKSNVRMRVYNTEPRNLSYADMVRKGIL